MFLDSDDYVEGPLLSGICCRMDANGADIGFGQTICDYEGDRPRRPIPLPVDTGSALFEGWCGEETFLAPCSVVWNSDYLRAIGGWAEELRRSQDSELVLRVLLMGARTCVSTEGAGIYVQHGGTHRITRSGNCTSCLSAVEKLLTVSAASFPRGTVERAIAARACRIAALAFDVNDAPLAEKAFKLARSLGVTARPGRRITQLLIVVIGLPITVRLRAWIMERRLQIAMQGQALTGNRGARLLD